MAATAHPSSLHDGSPTLLPPSSLRPGARPPPPWQTSSSAVALLGGGSAQRRPSAPSAQRRWAARRAGAAGGSDPGGRAAPSPAPSLAGLLRLRSGICTGNLQASNSRPARVSAAASGSTQPLVIFFLFSEIDMGVDCIYPVIDSLNDKSIYGFCICRSNILWLIDS